MIQRINKKNQVLGVSFEHADGSPATCADGWSSSSVELDEQGRVLTVKYYTASGELTDRGAGYAWEERVYPDRNQVRITRYALTGEPVETDGGYTTLCQELQEERVTRETFLNAEGQRILNREGVGTVLYDYDTEGRVTQVLYEDLNGHPIPCQAGYCGWRDILDEAGRVISRTFLGSDGLAADLAPGYAEIRYSYDGAGQLTGTRYFSASGLQVQQ